MDSTEVWIWHLLAWIVLPVWLGAGVADYVCHHRARIEHTTGLAEPLMHLFEAGQIGAAVLAIMLFEPSLEVVGFCVAMVLLHTATSFADVIYAARRRRIGVPEHLAHAFLIVMPIAAVLLVITLAATRSNFQGATGIVWRATPLPAVAILLVVALSAAFAVAPAIRECVVAVRKPFGSE